MWRDIWNEFKRWWLKNHTEIIWFFMGFFTFSLFSHLSDQDWLGAIFSAVVIYVNYKLRKIV